jgi:hypothetical protein
VWMGLISACDLMEDSVSSSCHCAIFIMRIVI